MMITLTDFELIYRVNDKERDCFYYLCEKPLVNAMNAVFYLDGNNLVIVDSINTLILRNLNPEIISSINHDAEFFIAEISSNEVTRIIKNNNTK
jgi:hypothetical protein